MCMWREVGSGLGPGPWFCLHTYDHGTYCMRAPLARGLCCIAHGFIITYDHDLERGGSYTVL
jgi:hypothetical protein